MLFLARNHSYDRWFRKTSLHSPKGVPCVLSSESNREPIPGETQSCAPQHWSSSLLLRLIFVIRAFAQTAHLRTSCRPLTRSISRDQMRAYEPDRLHLHEIPPAPSHSTSEQAASPSSHWHSGGPSRSRRPQLRFRHSLMFFSNRASVNLKRCHIDKEPLKSRRSRRIGKRSENKTYSRCTIFHHTSCILHILPYGEIDGPRRTSKVRPAVLSGHGLHENRDDRGVALEVARSSVSA